MLNELHRGEAFTEGKVLPHQRLRNSNTRRKGVLRWGGGGLGGRGRVAECGGLGFREGASCPVGEGGDWNPGWLWSPVGTIRRRSGQVCVE